jgi:hypothetical protein
MNEDEVNQPSDEQDVIGSSNDDRVARLNAIADQTDAGRADEFANVNDDGSTEPYTVASDQAETDDTTSSDEEQSATGDEDSTSTSTEPKRYRIKVNGKELELSESELIARAQKIEAADDYLRQAAEARRKLEQLAQPETDSRELQRRQDEEDRALVRAIQAGSEDEAASALRKLREQVSARPSLNPDDVSRTVDERLEFNKAIEKFRTEYSDIENDPYLRKLALDRDAELLQAGDRRSYWERYDEIGKSLRSWKTGLVSKEQSSLKEKETRKAAAPKVPSTASAKTKPPVQADDEDESPSAVIAAMSKTRGGPQWMRN